ncbi:hypothetical protein [Kitasatospora sp. NPDC001547]|nr:hypothetical protein KitaXyl93_17160 [Kitasatospora sp. Xyl93]
MLDETVYRTEGVPPPDRLAYSFDTEGSDAHLFPYEWRLPDGEA